MNTQHTRDLDLNYYVNAKGELLKIPSFTEEFFNKCHDEGGKFCQDAVHGEFKGGRKDKKPRGSIKDEAQRFAELFIGLPGQSSLKASKFAKKSLSRYSLSELCRFHSQFETDSKNLKTARKTAYLGIATIPLNTNFIPIAVISATRSSVVIGFTVWRNKQIKKQMDRIDAAVAKRKSKSNTFEVEEFQDGSTQLEPSLINEIRKAQKQIDAGKIEKVDTPPTKKELLDLQQYVNALRVDPEEGISQVIIDALRTTVEEALNQRS